MGREDRATTRRDAGLGVKAARKEKERRDGIGFIALPHIVIDSPGYRRASHTARSLLFDLARAFTGLNNGRIWLSRTAREAIGWDSESTFRRALADLIACGLVVETRKGGRNLAAWYGLTWRDLDVTDGLDIDPKHWRRAEYMRPEKAQGGADKARTAKATTARSVSAGLRACYMPAPPNGAASPPASPSNGATGHQDCTVERCSQAESAPSVEPRHGEYLEGSHLQAQRAFGAALPTKPARHRRLGLVLAQRIKHSINPAHRAAVFDVCRSAGLHRTAARHRGFIIPESLK